MARAEEPGSGREVAEGFGIGLALQLTPLALLTAAGIPCAFASGFLSEVCGGLYGLSFLLFGAIGVGQLLYIVPAVLWARRRGRTGVVKGIVIAAALVFVLNAACWGGVLWISTRG